MIAVGPGVLIPRPETELLVDFAAEVGPLNRPALRPLTPAAAPRTWAWLCIIVALMQFRPVPSVTLDRLRRLLGQQRFAQRLSSPV